MRAIAQPDGGGGAADFLDRDDMLEVAEAQPTKVFLYGDAVQTERTHLRPQVAGKPVFRIHPRGKWRDPIRREAACGLADRVGHLAEREVEVRGQMASPFVLFCPSVAWVFANESCACVKQPKSVVALLAGDDAIL